MVGFYYDIEAKARYNFLRVLNVYIAACSQKNIGNTFHELLFVDRNGSDVGNIINGNEQITIYTFIFIQYY